MDRAERIEGDANAGNSHARQGADAELVAAQNDVRDMQRAVIALRSELELVQAGRDAAVQVAVAEANQELSLIHISEPTRPY